MALNKRGLVQDAALPFAGKVHRIDPGVPPRLAASLTSPLVLQVGASDLKTLPVPAEKSTAMKYERGRLLLIAGSERYRGAAHLAVRGALASGAGSVRAALPKVVDQQLWQWAPEVVSEPALESDDSGSLLWGAALERGDRSRLDALLLGPGLGLMEGVWRGWAEPLQTFRGLLVLDADALNQLSGDVEGWRWFLKRMGPTWITPHPQEFERLFPGCDQGSPLDRAAAAETAVFTMLLREPREQLEVHRRAEVVRVGDEHVLVALGDERVERPRANERRVQIAVARRAPLAVGLRRPARRLIAILGDLRRADARHRRRQQGSDLPADERAGSAICLDIHAACNGARPRGPSGRRAL